MCSSLNNVLLKLFSFACLSALLRMISATDTYSLCDYPLQTVSHASVVLMCLFKEESA